MIATSKNNNILLSLFRDEFILTPSEFVELIKKAVASKVNVWVTDVFAVPDYCAFLKGCIDPSFARAHKEEWAQLQITFERAEVSETHPLGVRMTYKAYAQDTFVEIVEDVGKQSLFIVFSLVQYFFFNFIF